jgi:hypothetical protein
MKLVARHRRSAVAILGLAMCAAAFTGYPDTGAQSAEMSTCKYFSQLPDDCAEAVERKYDNLRNYRYALVDLFSRDRIKKVLYKSSYNTTGLNGGDESRDSAPKSLVDKLDPKAITKQYQALFAWINPPSYWTLDWFADRVGRVRTFGGLDAAWMGNSEAPANTDFTKLSSRAYRYIAVARTSAEGFNKGSKVYLLDDPKGRTWIMKSYTDRGIPGMTIDKLDTLGDLIKMPQGWKFRTAVLGKNLILIPKSGTAGVTQDDKQNTYDLTGPGQSNFIP